MSTAVTKSSITVSALSKSSSSASSLSKSSLSSTKTGKTPVIVDSYTESNWAFSLDYLDNDSLSGGGFGMNFSNSNNGAIDSCKFFLTKIGAPTGNIVAKLYAITGTYGVNSIPLGSALATSDAVSVTTIKNAQDSNNLVVSDYVLVSFTFSEANQYALQAGVNYIMTIEYSGGTTGNYLSVGGGDSNLPTGNPVQHYGSPWTTYTGDAYIFYVYASGGVSSTGVSKNSVSKSAVTKS